MVKGVAGRGGAIDFGGRPESGSLQSAIGRFVVHPLGCCRSIVDQLGWSALAETADPALAAPVRRRHLHWISHLAGQLRSTSHFHTQPNLSFDVTR